MTSVFSYNFENGTNAAAVTTTLSGFTNIIGTWTYSNAHVQSAAGGTLAGRCSASAGQSYAKGGFTAIPKVWARLYAYIETMPAATSAVYEPLAGSTVLAEMRITSTGAVQLRNSSFTQVAISPTGLITAGTFVRFAHYFDSAGTQQARVYVGANVNSTTPDWDSGAVATTATPSPDGFQTGIINSTTAAYHIDNVAADNATWVGPATTSDIPPVANAGPDQSNVEPWATVTLTGTDSDSDGTVTARAWAQTAGTTVTLSGTGTTRTFTAPGTLAGDTLTFGYTVTDNGGAVSVDSVNVAVLPATERAVIGGVEVPARFRAN